MREPEPFLSLMGFFLFRLEEMTRIPGKVPQLVVGDSE